MASNRLLLLTGAGFTKNFGGFLAKEMWSKMFSNPLTQQTSYIRKALAQDEDFESVYSSVMDSEESQDVKNTMNEIIDGAYRKLDDAIKTLPLMREDTCSTYGLNDLLSLFIHKKEGDALFFTLNQDLLMERHKGYNSPGVPETRRTSGPSVDLSPVKNIKLNPSITKELIRKDIAMANGFGYIKLHGSYGWKASDGSSRMVIGKGKTKTIENEPLLKAYFEIFQEAIAEGDKKILIMGYGFADEHINKVLADGVRKHNLKVFVLNPSGISKLRERLRIGDSDAEAILEGVTGVFQNTFIEIFPYDQRDTVHKKEIIEVLRQN